jgi:Zn-dependent protease with chaperone function
MQSLTRRERWLIAGASLAATVFWFALVLLSLRLLGRYLPGLDIEPRLGLVASALILTYLAGFLVRTARLAWLQGHAVEIGARQYPDLHVRLRHAAKRLAIEPAPRIFLFHANSGEPGLGLRWLGQEYIAINADVIGVLTPRPGTIDFFFGYELARLRDPLTRFGLILAPALVLPLLGPANARARIYRADRAGLLVCRHPEDAQLAVASLAARRVKPFSLVPFTAQGAHGGGFWMSLMALAASRPWLARRLERLRAAAGVSSDPPTPHHPAAYLGALWLPGLGAPSASARFGRSLLLLLWLPLIGGAWLEAQRWWHTPLASRYDNRVVPVPPARPAMARTDTPPAVDSSVPVETEAYERVNADLRYLGELAEARSRKQGGIVCELGNLEGLKLQLPAARYAFSCDEPLVYTVIEAGEFETGQPAFLHTYHWKDKRFMPRGPAPATAGPADTPNTADPR